MTTHPAFVFRHTKRAHPSTSFFKFKFIPLINTFKIQLTETNGTAFDPFGAGFTIFFSVAIWP